MELRERERGGGEGEGERERESEWEGGREGVGGEIDLCAVMKYC